MTKVSVVMFFIWQTDEADFHLRCRRLVQGWFTFLTSPIGRPDVCLHRRRRGCGLM